MAKSSVLAEKAKKKAGKSHGTARISKSALISAFALISLPLLSALPHASAVPVPAAAAAAIPVVPAGAGSSLTGKEDDTTVGVATVAGLVERSKMEMDEVQDSERVAAFKVSLLTHRDGKKKRKGVVMEKKGEDVRILPAQGSREQGLLPGKSRQVRTVNDVPWCQSRRMDKRQVGGAEGGSRSGISSVSWNWTEYDSSSFHHNIEREHATGILEGETSQTTTHQPPLPYLEPESTVTIDQVLTVMPVGLGLLPAADDTFTRIETIHRTRMTRKLTSTTTFYLTFTAEFEKPLETMADIMAVGPKSFTSDINDTGEPISISINIDSGHGVGQDGETFTVSSYTRTTTVAQPLTKSTKHGASEIPTHVSGINDGRGSILTKTVTLTKSDITTKVSTKTISAPTLSSRITSMSDHYYHNIPTDNPRSLGDEPNTITTTRPTRSGGGSTNSEIHRTTTSSTQLVTTQLKESLLNGLPISHDITHHPTPLASPYFTIQTHPHEAYTDDYPVETHPTAPSLSDISPSPRPRPPKPSEVGDIHTLSTSLFLSPPPSPPTSVASNPASGEPCETLGRYGCLPSYQGVQVCSYPITPGGEGGVWMVVGMCGRDEECMDDGWNGMPYCVAVGDDGEIVVGGDVGGLEEWEWGYGDENEEGEGNEEGVGVDRYEVGDKGVDKEGLDGNGDVDMNGDEDVKYDEDVYLDDEVGAGVDQAGSLCTPGTYGCDGSYDVGIPKSG